MPDDLGKFGNPLPVAIVVEKPALLAGFQIFGGIGPGLAHIALDPGADRVDPIGKETGQIDGAVPPIVGNLRVGDGGSHGSSGEISRRWEWKEATGRTAYRAPRREQS